MKSIRLTVTAAIAALVLSTSLLGSSAIAQYKMGGKMDKMAGPVYVSKSSKMGFTGMQAKKMAMKDGKGMKLVKMSTLPTGYKMAPAMDHKMDGKMGGKMDHKMGGKM